MTHVQTYPQTDSTSYRDVWTSIWWLGCMSSINRSIYLSISFFLFLSFFPSSIYFFLASIFFSCLSPFTFCPFFPFFFSFSKEDLLGAGPPLGAGPLGWSGPGWNIDSDGDGDGDTACMKDGQPRKSKISLSQEDISFCTGNVGKQVRYHFWRRKQENALHRSLLPQSQTRILVAVNLTFLALVVNRHLI